MRQKMDPRAFVISTLLGDRELQDALGALSEAWPQYDAKSPMGEPALAVDHLFFSLGLRNMPP